MQASVQNGSMLTYLLPILKMDFIGRIPRLQMVFTGRVHLSYV